MKAIGFILLAAIGHYLLSGVIAMMSLSLVMGRFDLGSPPTLAESVLLGISGILMFPVGAVHFGGGSVLSGPNSLLWGSILSVLNSLLWGALAGALFLGAQHWMKGVERVAN